MVSQGPLSFGVGFSSWEEEGSTDPVLLALLLPPPSLIFVKEEEGGGGPRELDLHCFPPPTSKEGTTVGLEECATLLARPLSEVT
eukprot:8280948-Pyramimonas_sp.AAC.1